jgi:serine O-acetyltransferase
MSGDLDKLAGQLLDSYAAVGGINHMEGTNLPSKASVASITQTLLHLLFPGFFQAIAEREKSVARSIGQALEDVCAPLAGEIAKSLEFAPLPGAPASAPAAAKAREITCAFLSRLPDVRQLLSTDVEAAYDGDPAAKSYEEIILSYPGIEAIAVQRLAHELHRLGVALIPRMMTEWAHSRTGIDIHPGARIGASFFIDHGTGVVIGETCVIGERVKIYHGVTLGAKSTSGGQQLRDRKRHPTLEDGVTIYPNATILGGDTVIGRGSTIGGNVFIVESIPADSLVVYEKASLAITVKKKNGLRAGNEKGSLAVSFEI